MAQAAGTDPFQVLEAFYIESGKLKENEATVYVLALKRGQITASIVEEETRRIDVRAAKRLFHRLEKLGFLKAQDPPPPDRRGGSGNQLVYIPCSPSMIASKERERLAEMTPVFDQLDEHLESIQLLPQSDREGAIFIQKDHEVGIKDLIGIIRNAKESVLMAGRDCSAVDEPGFIPALEEILDKNISVSVVSNVGIKPLIGLRKKGLKVARNDCKLMPFVIIDKAHIMIAYKPNHTTPKYQFIMSTNRYLIDKYSAIFWHFFKTPGR